VLKKAFDAFDREKSGSISTNMVEEILRLMGQPFNRNTLEELIDEVDADSKHRQNSLVFRISFKRQHALALVETVHMRSNC
jgi:Ca2+-binding EF-hand superfamily protein